MNVIKIILVDDHQMFRDGIKAVLSDEENVEVIGEVGNAKDLYKLLNTAKPDLIITDISMPDISGIEVTQFIKEKFSTINILILSMHSNEEFITKALNAGANGYLPKDTSMRELLKAIYSIHEGENYFNKEISDTILKSIANKHKAPRNETLTTRELEVVTHVVDGLSNKEIADKLHISVRTIDTHKNNILHKLGLKSSIELVKYAIKNKLVQLD